MLAPIVSTDLRRRRAVPGVRPLPLARGRAASRRPWWLVVGRPSRPRGGHPVGYRVTAGGEGAERGRGPAVDGGGAGTDGVRDAGRPGLRHGLLPRPDGRDPHALAQLDRLRRRPEIDLRLVSGGSPSPTGWPTGSRSRSAPRRAAGADAERPAVVANQALAADRVVDRAGRLGLQPGRVRRADPGGAPGGDQSRRLAGRPLRPAAGARAAGRVVRAGRPGPLGLAVQHGAAARRLPRLRGAGRVRPQRGRGPVLRAGRRPRAGAGPRRPGAAAGGAVPALGGQFPAEEEPGAADPGGGAAPRGGRAASWRWCSWAPGPTPRSAALREAAARGRRPGR